MILKSFSTHVTQYILSPNYLASSIMWKCIVFVILPVLLPTSSVGGGLDGSADNSDGVKLTSRIVHTKYGSVSGVIIHLDGRHLDPVEAFRGIPYASPPIGSLRFMPPVTGALWSGVKKAERLVK